MVSDRIFLHYLANPVFGRKVKITIQCTTSGNNALEFMVEFS